MTTRQNLLRLVGIERLADAMDDDREIIAQYKTAAMDSPILLTNRLGAQRVVANDDNAIYGALVELTA